MSATDSRPVRMALFGGSFDPVHRGHLAMARKVMESVELDRILFLPCFVSPHKAGTTASPAQRLEMLRLSLEEEPVEGAGISRLEIERETPSYSWETVETVSRREPEVEWSWIVGTDQWNALETWARPGILRKRLRFIVCPRGGEVLVERPGWKSVEVSFSHPASSTAIRADFERHADWLTPGVADYCRRERIYS